MEINLHPNTVAGLIFEFEDLLKHGDLEGQEFEDIANLLNLFVTMDKGSTIHIHLT
jgi:hypothetical protein